MKKIVLDLCNYTWNTLHPSLWYIASNDNQLSVLCTPHVYWQPKVKTKRLREVVCLCMSVRECASVCVMTSLLEQGTLRLIDGERGCYGRPLWAHCLATATQLDSATMGLCHGSQRKASSGCWPEEDQRKKVFIKNKKLCWYFLLVLTTLN